jgi:hypothetical protein
VPKRKVSPCVSVYRSAKIDEVLTLGRSLIWISKFGRLKILKIRKNWGPLVSRSSCLNGSHRSPMRTRVTPRAVMLWWPYAACGHRPMWEGPYLFVHGAVEETHLHFSFSLAAAPLPLCLALLHTNSTTAAGHHPALPSWSKLGRSTPLNVLYV